MTDQTTLWMDPPRARRVDPETSKDAAVSMRDVTAHHHRLILAALTLEHGAIYTDLAVVTGLTPVQVNRRLCELRNLGLVEQLPTKRATPSGRLAFCYRRGSNGKV